MSAEYAVNPYDEDEFLMCERCGCCVLEWVECEACGGEGHSEPGDLYEQDPLWYDENDIEECSICEGEGGWWMCLGRCDENGQHEKIEKVAEAAEEDEGCFVYDLTQTRRLGRDRSDGLEERKSTDSTN